MTATASHLAAPAQMLTDDSGHGGEGGFERIDEWFDTTYVAADW